MGYEVDVIQVAAACIMVILIGYCLSRFKIFSPDEFKNLATFNSNVPFAFFLFRALAPRKIREISFFPLWDSLLMSASTQLLVAISCVVLPLKDKLYTYLSTVVSSCYINYLIIGLPIFNSIWGTDYDQVPAICTFTHYVLLVPVFLVLAQLWNIMNDKKNAEQDGVENGQESTPQSKRKITIKDVGMAFWVTLKTPLLVGNIIGLIWSAIGIPYPPFVDHLARFFGDVVMVTALVGIGRFLQVHSILACSWIQLLTCLAIRFFVCPGFAALFAWALKLDGRLSRQCTILSCLPAANAGFVLGNSVGVGANVASAMVFWSLLLIVPILIFWFFIFNTFNLFPEED